MILRHNCVSEIFYPKASSFLLTGATWYYHAIYIVITYFASIRGYRNDIFYINFDVSRCKCGELMGGKLADFFLNQTL